MTQQLRVVFATCFVALCFPGVHGNEDIYIPDSLQPWVDWILEENPHVSCPVSASDGSRLSCLWVTETNINVSRTSTFGATFALKVHAFAESSVQLPFRDSLKPQSVRLDGQSVAIGGGNNAPEVRVPKGSHTIRGQLVWTKETEPNYLVIQRSGVVRLAIDNEPVKHPSIQSSGSRLWFSADTSESETDELTQNTETVQVFRHFVDDRPQTLTTHIQVAVTGSPRILEFGQVNSDDFEVTDVNSKWPAVVSRDGNLVVQVEPGVNDIQIEARATEHLNSLEYHKSSAMWPAFEYWGIEPNHELRIIRMEGAQRTDLSQVNAPRSMRDLSGFVLDAGAELKLIEEPRGSTELYPSSFAITRDIWLNFRGDSYTVADSIDADLSKSQRVTSNIPLGEVRVEGDLRLITYDDSGEKPLSSIYLESGDSRLTAVSKVSRDQALPPNSWNIDVDTLNARLHLPPGWMLLWSHGIDNVEHSWLSTWGIWDIFMVLLLICLVWGLGGWKWTILAAVAAIISYQIDWAPTVGWMVLGGLLYVMKTITHTTLSRITRGVYWVVFVVVSFACLFHATTSLRNALHPQLAHQRLAPMVQAATHFGTEEIYVTGSRMFISDPNASVERYTSGDIQRMGRSDFFDFFRKILQQFNSSHQESLAQTATMLGDEDIYVTGTNMLIADPSESVTRYSAEDLKRMGASDLVDYFRGAEQLAVVKFDPTMPIAIQTGPGKPKWESQLVNMSWIGAVDQSQTMRLVLMPPWATRILYVLSAVVTLWVLGYLLLLKAPGFKNCFRNVLRGTSSVASVVLFGLLFTPQDVQADLPDQDLLDELERRLLALPDCLEDCAYLETAQVELTDSTLTITMRIHSEDRVAVPLPDENGTWNVVDVRQGTIQLPLLRDRTKLYTILDEGIHDLTLAADISGLNQLDILFELIPGHLQLTAPNWSVEGLVRGQIGDRTLTFNRLTTAAIEEPSAAMADFTPLEIVPYVSVERQINLDYEPTLTTRVSRVAPASGEFTVRVPLLPNELVTSPNMSIENDMMVVHLKRNQNTFAWASRLDVGTSITLRAPPIAERTERWSIVGSDFWNYNYEGIEPIKQADLYGTFVPLSDEVLLINAVQTQPVPGTSWTIHRVDTHHSVDRNSTNSRSLIHILASQPGEIEITLPNNTLVEEVWYDGEVEPFSANQNVVLLPVKAGDHAYTIDWKTDAGTSIFYRTPTETFDQRVANVQTTVRNSEDRWTLWLAGPSFGTTVGLWTVLFGVLIAGFAISKIPGIAITTTDAVIVTLGATFVSLNVLLCLGIWFLAIWIKSRANEEVSRKWLYHLGQTVLGVLTLIVLFVVVDTLAGALTGNPNMYISGMSNASSSFEWFSDEVTGTVPSPWILSLPLWVYFVVMLAWSIWLVFATLKWLRVWWHTVKTPVLWFPITGSGWFSKQRRVRQKETSIVEGTATSRDV